MAKRSLPKRLWYVALQCVLRLVGVMLFHLRIWGREHVPATGGALILSSHQSHLDPILVGVAAKRRLNYLARESLFAFASLGWLIRSLDAIPIDREGMGISGLKETLRRIRDGEIVLIFPEGTRSRDGEVAALKPGFSALAKRARVPLVPAAIEGAFDAWPRWRHFPVRSTIHVVFGQPITPDEAACYTDRELVAEVERRIRACQAQARQTRTRATNGSVDASRHG